MIIRMCVGWFGLLLGGCAVLPESPTTRGLQISQVVDAIQCDLASVYRVGAEFGKQLDHFTAKVELELRVLASTSIGTDVNLIVPVSSAIATFNPNIGFESSAGRISNLKFFVVMKNLRKNECAYRNHVIPTSMVQAQSHLGLAEWIKTSLVATERRDQADLDTMSYAVEFIVLPKAGGSFGLEVARWKPTAPLSASLKDTQTLNISFARDEGPSITRVSIENWPAYGSGGRLQGLTGGAGQQSGQSRGSVAVNPTTQYKLDRELQQNRLPTVFGIQRAPIGF